MSNHEERMKILEMISNGTVTAEEGARLLEASGSASEAPAPKAETKKVKVVQSNGNGDSKRRLRVKVQEENGTRVNVNLPLSLMEIGLKIGGRFVDELQDMDDEMQMLIEAMKNDVTGKIVEVEDEDSHVEVFIE
jgi:hypothetical protein